MESIRLIENYVEASSAARVVPSRTPSPKQRGLPQYIYTCTDHHQGVRHCNDQVHVEKVYLELRVSQYAPPGGAASKGPGGLSLALLFLMTFTATPMIPPTTSNPKTTASEMAPIVEAIDFPSE